MSDEMQFHIESKTRELMDTGMSDADARLEARRRFGSVWRTSRPLMPGIWTSRKTRSGAVSAIRRRASTPFAASISRSPSPGESVFGKGNKERIVPLGRPAVDALVRYVSRGRPYLDKRHRPELFGALRTGAQPLWVIDPASGPGGTREAFLPTEMEFPLHALWSVSRPGPKLELYALQ